MDAVPPPAARPDTRSAGVRTRAVIALVRPCDPNLAVIDAAADLAQQHGTALLVLGTVDCPMADWADGLDTTGSVIEAAHGELFATCVENLWHRELVWGVNVQSGRVTAELVNLTGRVEVVRVVRGHRHPPTLRRRIRRLFTGRLDDVLEQFHGVVVV